MSGMMNGMPDSSPHHAPTDSGPRSLTLIGTNLVTASEGGWRQQAPCAETDPEEFFADVGGSTRIAKQVCGACEVRPECLSHALANDERYGVWGGLSERERRRLKRSQA